MVPAGASDFKIVVKQTRGGDVRSKRLAAVKPMHLAFLVISFVVCLPLLYVSAIAAAGPIFKVETPVTPVDVIVVLGGEGATRAAKAAAVYRSIAFAKPRILISGDGDCRDIANLVIADGVPSHRVSIECRSRNTWENAKFSEPLLAGMGARSAILVTSWFHARRALSCFKLFNPTIRWASAPAERQRPLWQIALDAEGNEAAKEYLKVAWYTLRHGLVIF